LLGVVDDHGLIGNDEFRDDRVSCGECTPIVVERHVIALAGKRSVKIVNRSALEDRMSESSMAMAA
jgi:hypothetical protein